MAKDNGGPAFPTIRYDVESPWSENGMSLRDWFAGLAMQGIVIHGFSLDADMVARAYQIADALLAERSKQ